MNLSNVFIRRPVFTIALTLVLIIIGVISFSRLSVREYPRMDKPTISIRTNYTGASAELIENDITTPIENLIASVSGIDSMRSTSMQGRSNINIDFQDDYDINIAMNDIRDKLSAVSRFLPEDADAPIIRKNDSDSMPTIVVAVTDKNKNSLQLTDYINRYIEPLLQQVQGVSNVWTWGARNYAMRAWLDPEKMAARGVTVSDITTMLQQQNENSPAGDIKSATRDYPVVANAELTTPEQFKNLVVRDQNGIMTRFSDVADIGIGSENIDSSFRVMGHAGVAMGVIAESTANPVNISKGVYEVIDELKNNLPTGMQVKVISDNAIFINQSIHEVYRTLLEALVLVLLVVFLFLGSLRSTFIPVVTIPVCLIGVFAGLYLYGYSINTITLLGLVLAIGLVVDDAIVMLENIYRHIEEGAQPMAAAFQGSKEIVFPIIAMTLTLVAVYLPIAFTQGLTGILFRQFALTLAGAVVISGFVALTLTPMMCSRMLKPIGKANRYAKWLDQSFERLLIGFKRLLRLALVHRPWIIATVVMLGLLGAWVYINSPTELAPSEDRGMIRAVIQAPTNSSFNYTEQYAKQVEEIYKGIPEMQSYLMSVGFPVATRAFSIVSLSPQNERKRTQTEITRQLRAQFKKLAGVTIYAMSPAPFGRRSSSNQSINVQIMTTSSYTDLAALVDSLIKQLKSYPGLIGVDSALTFDNQQFQININRDLAADVQVNVADIGAALSTFLGGKIATSYEVDGQSYDVMLQMKRSDLQDLSGLSKINVRSATGKMIPLSTLVSVKPEVSPMTLPHYDRMRADSIGGELAPGYTVGQVVGYLQTFMQTHLPNSAKYAFSGSVKDYLQSHGRMNMIFLLALVFIYLVLAAQFESFVDPLIVLLSVPLSLVGGLVVLRLAGGTLNIFSQIGLVTLMGLITKHGILITEFANQLRAQGKDIYTAIVEATALRLRPILMTTGAMVLGALPLALATGAGAASRQQVGWVIVGGMTFGTFFSLFVGPTAYLYLSRRDK